MKKVVEHTVLFFFLVIIGVMGCDDNDSSGPASLPTRGELTIGIDESLQPFAEAEIFMFSDYYPDARITPLYLPEKVIVEKLLSNEIHTGIICRDLFPEESSFIAETYSHTVKTFKLAEDAIIAVVNSENPVNTISPKALKGILSGTLTEWGRLSPSIESISRIHAIITASSSIDRYFSTIASLSPDATYTLDTTTQVIDYVKNNASAIGIVGGSWFYRKGSDKTDVKILSYFAGDNESGDEGERPYREVFVVTHEPNTGLGNGFISFLAGQKGQLILSKAGLTPSKPIERKVKLTDSFPD